MKNRVILASIVAFTLVAASVKAQTIAQWTFETAVSTNAINSNLSPGANITGPAVPADVGVGIANAHHTTTSTYSTPAGDVDLTLAPSISSSIHSWSANGWSAGDYYQFQVSTVGFTGVQVGWDQTGSNTGPRDFSLQYSLDGGATFITPGSTYSLLFNSWTTSAALGNNESQTFAGAVDNAPSVIFRVVDMSTVSVNGGSIGTGGTDRVDNFTVFSPVPEPSTVALVGAGLFGMLAMRRRRS
jgi:hypothetical protein